MLRAAGRGPLRTVGVFPRRPHGITLLAVVFLVWGLYVAVLGIMEGVRAGFGSRGASGLGAFIAFAQAAVLVAASFGLWDMRRWAWGLAFLVAAVSFVLAFGTVVWMLAWGAVVMYLISAFASFEPFAKRVRRAMT